MPTDDIDGQRLRLESIIRSGIEPKLPRLTIEAINIDGVTVIEIAVGQSFVRPHWVSARDERRFYLRTSAGKARMSIDEVRSAFQSSGHVFERAEGWRDGAISELTTGISEMLDGENVWMSLQICPTSAFSGPFVAYFDPRPAKDHSKRLRTVSTDNTNGSPHYKGLLTEERGPNSDLRERLLINRDFRIDALWRAGGQSERGRLIYAGSNEDRLNKWFEHFLGWARDIGYPFPAFVLITAFNAGQSHIYSSWRNYQSTSDILKLRPVFVEDANVTPATVLRPAYDHLWQSYGFSECIMYDEAGEFSRQLYDPRAV